MPDYPRSIVVITENPLSEWQNQAAKLIWKMLGGGDLEMFHTFRMEDIPGLEEGAFSAPGSLDMALEDFIAGFSVLSSHRGKKAQKAFEWASLLDEENAGNKKLSLWLLAASKQYTWAVVKEYADIYFHYGEKEVHKVLMAHREPTSFFPKGTEHVVWKEDKDTLIIEVSRQENICLRAVIGYETIPNKPLYFLISLQAFFTTPFGVPQWHEMKSCINSIGAIIPNEPKWAKAALEFSTMDWEYEMSLFRWWGRVPVGVK